jgi:hypothetical protein
VSKTLALVWVFLCVALFTTASKAQILPRGNVYLGAAYSDSAYVTTRYPFKGWNASLEALPLTRFPHLGFVLDGSGYYRRGITEYELFLGPRFSIAYAKWRPFVHAMGGEKRVPVNGITYNRVAVDLGGGVDYKLFFKNFSWRLQGDYVHSNLLSAKQNDVRASTGIVWRF